MNKSTTILKGDKLLVKLDLPGYVYVPQEDIETLIKILEKSYASDSYGATNIKKFFDIKPLINDDPSYTGDSLLQHFVSENAILKHAMIDMVTKDD